MQAVILVGGLGTRISEEISSRPKPLIEISGRPIYLAHNEEVRAISLHQITEYQATGNKR